MSLAIEGKIKKFRPSTIRHPSFRIESIDVLRGLVMIIMALDHTRDFFHFGAYLEDPLGIGTTTPALFFTRYVTHFCAPIFVFLAGTSIYLQGLRKSKSELGTFLVKRGIWLIFVEFFIMSFAFTFDIHYNIIILQVIWSIGISMILLGLLVKLPLKIIFAIGLIIVLGHNLLDFAEANHKGGFGFIWDLVHRGNFASYPLWGQHRLVILYPFMPWTGLLFLGYTLGKLYAPTTDPKYRRKVLSLTGTGLLLFFVILRASNLYGDPKIWAVQRTSMYSIFSFLNVNKYPPSLLYMCITIGPGLLFLAAFEKTKNRVTNILAVYGRVPFFYYILHFYLIHIVCVILFLARGHSFSSGLQGIPGFPFKFVIPGEGYHLWIVYLIWLSIVAILYPLCKWYSNYKLTHRKWWLSYL